MLDRLTNNALFGYLQGTVTTRHLVWIWCDRSSRSRNSLEFIFRRGSLRVELSDFDISFAFDLARLPRFDGICHKHWADAGCLRLKNWYSRRLLIHVAVVGPSSQCCSF